MVKGNHFYLYLFIFLSILVKSLDSSAKPFHVPLHAAYAIFSLYNKYSFFENIYFIYQVH